MPKIVSTPQSIKVPTNTSLAVGLAMSRSMEEKCAPPPRTFL
jgi:hypothetical protein